MIYSIIVCIERATVLRANITHVTHELASYMQQLHGFM